MRKTDRRAYGKGGTRTWVNFMDRYGIYLLGASVAFATLTTTPKGYFSRMADSLFPETAAGAPADSGHAAAMPAAPSDVPAGGPPELTDDGLIAYHARRVGVDANMIRAIRRAENGGPGIEFGIIPTEGYRQDEGFTDENGVRRAYRSSFEKQLCWCAWTIRRNMDRWNAMASEDRESHGNSFIRYLGSRYAPVGAGNDPNGLNENWIRNVSTVMGRD
jgi:hypothetical protein